MGMTSRGGDARGTPASALKLQLSLQRLTSPALPVGAFSYSRGLEAAVEMGAVGDEASALAWIDGVLRHGVAPLDGAVFARLHRAFQAGDYEAAQRWGEHLQATRESCELQDEDRNMGVALVRLLEDLGSARRGELTRDAGFVAAFALATVREAIPLPVALAGLLWTFCEAQVSAAIRLVPLGQTAGQRMLVALEKAVVAAVEATLELADEDVGNTTPGLAMASAAHETQYSRLFRS
ncbi:MAG: hypothetical protein OXR73_18035, partial [Myxococcales bacterium]|nr:hypothetical protein [Myxococcales bacterium]